MTHIVHGATITPLSRGTAAEAKREPEAENPGRIIEVNTMGTVAILDWARTLPRLQRLIYVSSGAVYKHHGPDRPGEPLPEDGYVMPRRLYGISKLASELITERYGDLFGLSTASVRPSSVYGTMDRVTASRNFRHVPNRLAHMALDGVERVRVNTLDAVGDYIHSEDVARGHRVAAARAAAALQCLQYRRRRGGNGRRVDRLDSRKGAGLSRRDHGAPERRTSCRIQRSKTACGALTTFRASRRKPAGSPGPCARLCTRTWIGSSPNADRAAEPGTHDMNSSESYPRDLVGYGATPPHPRWPHDARIAVSVVLNYEEGGESCVLHGDAGSESVLTDVGGEPVQGARNLNVESNFEYGSRVGFWEIMRLLQGYGVEATIYAVGMALERNPEAAAEIARSGFEVACHGQRWIDYQFVSEADRARRHGAQHRDHHAHDRPAAARLVHRPAESQYPPTGGRERRFSVRQRCVQRRFALLDARSPAGRIW